MATAALLEVADRNRADLRYAPSSLFFPSLQESVEAISRILRLVRFCVAGGNARYAAGGLRRGAARVSRLLSLDGRDLVDAACGTAHPHWIVGQSKRTCLSSRSISRLFFCWRPFAW